MASRLTDLMLGEVETSESGPSRRFVAMQQYVGHRGHTDSGKPGAFGEVQRREAPRQTVEAQRRAAAAQEQAARAQPQQRMPPTIQSRPRLGAALRMLAACYVELGKADEARATISEMVRLEPDISLRKLSVRRGYSRPIYQERYVKALRRAGLPE